MKTLNIIYILVLLFSVAYSQLSCPAGRVLQQSATPSTNGCGPESTNPIAKAFNNLGKEIVSKFQNCCNDHDVCYGVCGISKNDCDTTFKQCMDAKCTGSKLSKTWCKTKREVLYQLVDKFGKSAFNVAQKDFCKCS